MINKVFLVLAGWLMTVSFISAQSLTLEESYRLARENYPVIKKMNLISRSADYTVKNANKKFLPQLGLTAQATIQSQVVDYSELLGGALPSGVTPPEFSKDQYRIAAEAEQLLFDGGNTRYQNDLTKANANLQQQQVEVALYAIKERINAIFFSIFLIDAQLELNTLKIANLQSQRDKTAAAYKYGTAYASDVNELEAEIENTKSTNIDYKGNRSAFLKMLSIFVGREVSSSSELIKPNTMLVSDEINRPELKLYDFQKSVYETQTKQLKSGYLPKASVFFQGAYGRPTLNPISNDFGAWYITGIRLNWSLGSLYTLKNQRAIYDLNSKANEVDRESFVQNVKMDIAQQDENIRKYSEMLAQDSKTISLRESVTRSASAQLANGVITTHEYIQKVNNENAAKQNLILHEIQLLQAQYNLKFKSGN